MSASSDSLQLEKDLAFQRREWRVQRVGWVVMALFVAAGVGGLFGHGVLSRQQEESGGLRIAYERFGRTEAVADLQVWVTPSEPWQGERVSIEISRQYVDAQRVDSIVPEPVEIQPGDATVVYHFPVPPAGNRAYVVFNLAPQKMGQYHGEVRAQGQSVPIRCWVHP